MLAANKICKKIFKKNTYTKENSLPKNLKMEKNNSDNKPKKKSKNLLLCKEKDIMIAGGNHKSEEEIKEFLKSILIFL